MIADFNSRIDRVKVQPADIPQIEPITMELRPSKKKRIALLEKQVEELQRRILALEERPKFATGGVIDRDKIPWTQPWSPPLGPTYGPVDLTPKTGGPVVNVPTVTCADIGDLQKELISPGWIASPASDLAPRHAMESTDGVRDGTHVVRNGCAEPAILGP